MNQDTKKRLANSIMVFAILLIVFSGVMAVGSIKGWFDRKGDPSTFTVADKVGEASIERSGIAYSLQKGTILKSGDQIETLEGASFHLSRPDSDIIVNENTLLSITACSPKKLAFKVEKGELYIQRNAQNPQLDVAYGEHLISWKDAKTALSVDVQEGTQNVHVLSGSIEITYPEESIRVAAGKYYSSIAHTDGNTERTVQDYKAEALDDFVLCQALKYSKSGSLCFTADTMKAVVEERNDQKKKANEELLTIHKKVIRKEKQGNDNSPAISPSETAGEKEQTTVPTDEKKKLEQNDNKTGNKLPSSVKPSQAPDKKQNDKTASEKPEKTKNPEKNKDKNPKSSKKPKDTDEKIYTCTISISCTTILSHMDDLKEGKSAYVPSDGAVLTTTKVEFTAGETVYDILKRVCDKLKIQLEASYTPIYDSYYVEGIHNLYEFDCGRQSGWMFKVNGWYPNYGCSSYKVKDGDAIVWNYTCEGLGNDLS